jgi:cobalt-zinc-cadmium efflux system protein
VLGVHDLHIWSTGSGDPMLSAHVRVAEATLPESPALLTRLRSLLQEKFGIGHTTLQVECVDCEQSCVEYFTKAGKPATPKLHLERERTHGANQTDC